MEFGLGFFVFFFYSLGHLVLGEQLTIVLMASLNLGRRNPNWMLPSCANPVSVSCNLFTGFKELEWHWDTLQILNSRDRVITSPCSCIQLKPPVPSKDLGKSQPQTSKVLLRAGKGGAGHKQPVWKMMLWESEMKIHIKILNLLLHLVFWIGNAFPGMSLPAMEIRNQPWL